MVFENKAVTINKNTYITDDPSRSMQEIIELVKGQPVTYLGTFHNQDSWAYIETTNSEGQTVRGFVNVDDVNGIN